MDRSFAIPVMETVTVARVFVTLVNIPRTKATLMIMNRSRTCYATFGGKSDDFKDDLGEV